MAKTVINPTSSSTSSATMSPPTTTPFIIYVHIYFPSNSLRVLLQRPGSDAPQRFIDAIYQKLINEFIAVPAEIQDITLSGTRYTRAIVAMTTKPAAGALAVAADDGLCVEFDSVHASGQLSSDSAMDSEGAASTGGSDSFTRGSMSSGAAVGIAVAAVAIVALVVGRSAPQTGRGTFCIQRQCCWLQIINCLPRVSRAQRMRALRLLVQTRMGLANRSLMVTMRAYDNGRDHEHYDQGQAADDVYSLARSANGILRMVLAMIMATTMTSSRNTAMIKQMSCRCKA